MAARWLAAAQRLDVAVYVAVARTPMPRLDRGMQRLSRLADRSRLNVLAAALIAAAGGADGRRAARSGLRSVAAASLLVNALVKPLARRRRPDRAGHGVPRMRHVPMPTSRSLPSGHAASAFAFAAGVSHVLPRAAGPLRLLAATVGYSRVHTGVHYPGDVIAGGLLGTAIAHALSLPSRPRRHKGMGTAA
jgi:membrane-associated phospholipid phosphatase